MSGWCCLAIFITIAMRGVKLAFRVRWRQGCRRQEILCLGVIRSDCTRLCRSQILIHLLWLKVATPPSSPPKKHNDLNHIRHNTWYCRKLIIVDGILYFGQIGSASARSVIVYERIEKIWSKSDQNYIDKFQLNLLSSGGPLKYRYHLIENDTLCKIYEKIPEY